MRILKSLFLSVFVVLFLASCASTQKVLSLPNFDTPIKITPKQSVLSDEEKKFWSHADLMEDSIAGMSLAKAYQFLEGKKSIPVIVAIADSGVDIEHEDLKDVLWTNTKEIKGNSIDDDKNGYVDDIHGWNFLGNASGKIINADQLEITRLVKKGREKFGDKKAEDISENDKAAFEAYQKLEQEYRLTISQKEFEIQEMEQTQNNLERLKAVFEDVRRFAGKDNLRINDLDSLKPSSLLMITQIETIKKVLENGATEEDLIGYLKEVKDYKGELLKAMKGYDLNLNDRANLGDNLYDINDKFYGNNNVIGNKDLEKHGTHVAGIVAASRNNNKGAKGVANTVKIMTVRVVPDGDEHDKDVALGIRYAVDNGAKIINTSFGKRFSPNKEWVFDAIAYAAKKDVLIVNAAGNDSKNIDIQATYPNDSKDLKTEFADNVITIGASSLYYNEKLVATFSNYGKINVDIFAPGVDIYSTVPKNEYEPLSGTSMASPSTSGVAALIRAYYPNLSAKEVKYILMNSGVKIDFKVIKPGSQTEENPTGELVPFEDLSASGRLVNAYNALQLADYLSRKNSN